MAKAVEATAPRGRRARGARPDGQLQRLLSRGCKTSALLRDRRFGLLWLGGLVSLTGNWVLMAGLPLAVYQLTDSTLATGGIFIATMIPRIVLGTVAGVVVDRWDRRTRARRREPRARRDAAASAARRVGGVGLARLPRGRRPVDAGARRHPRGGRSASAPGGRRAARSGQRAERPQQPDRAADRPGDRRARRRLRRARHRCRARLDQLSGRRAPDRRDRRRRASAARRALGRGGAARLGSPPARLDRGHAGDPRRGRDDPHDPRLRRDHGPRRGDHHHALRAVRRRRARRRRAALRRADLGTGDRRPRRRRSRSASSGARSRRRGCSPSRRSSSARSTSSSSRTRPSSTATVLALVLMVVVGLPAAALFARRTPR